MKQYVWSGTNLEDTESLILEAYVGTSLLLELIYL